MRSLALTSSEALRDCVYDAQRQEFLVTFRNGRLYRLPRDLLPEDDRSEVLGVQVERDGSAFMVRLASGHSVEVPWDFVLYHLEPKYPYFKIRPSQKQLEKDLAIRIGRKLRELREEKDLTANEVARRSGIHRPNISRVESGKHLPTVETLNRLARALGVPLTVLISDGWNADASVGERGPRYRVRRGTRGRGR